MKLSTPLEAAIRKIKIRFFVCNYLPMSDIVGNTGSD